MHENKRQDLILERINKLIKLAEENFKEHPKRSHRYIELIRKLSMRYNVRLPREIKRRICNKCHRFLVPGENSRIRANKRQEAIIITCLECNNVMRYPYRKEKFKFIKNKKTNIKRG